MVTFSRQSKAAPSLDAASSKRDLDDPYEFLSSDEDEAPAAQHSTGTAVVRDS